MQNTLVLLKPDTIQRGLVGQIISRFENKWIKISAMKMMMMSEDLVNEHYDFLMDKPFFPSIKSYMSGSPLVAMVLTGPEAIEVVRTMIGATNSKEALPGTIRGDFGMTMDANIIHASDSLETAVVEIRRFFSESEVFNYTKISDSVI